MSSFGLIEKNMELSHIYLAVPLFPEKSGGLQNYENHCTKQGNS